MSSPQNHLGRSDLLILVAIVFGLLHHIDHVLRYDHSGWPFLRAVSPFTFSLFAYPLLLTALWWRSRPWLRVFLVGFVLVAVQSAHTFIETPSHQYDVWAHNASSEPYAWHHPNLLNVESPFLGYTAVIVSILLSLALLAATISLAVDAWRRTA